MKAERLAAIQCGCIGCRTPLGTVAHQRLADDCLDCRRWEYLLAQKAAAR